MAISTLFSRLNPFRTVNKLRSQVTDLTKQLDTYKIGMMAQTERPINDLEQIDRYYFDYNPSQLTEFYILSKRIDLLRIILRALRTECFRNGYEVIEAINTDTDITVTEEETEIVDIEKSRKELLIKLENINDNGQSITELSNELEDDFNIADNAYMLFRFNYGFNNKGEIAEKEFVEAIRVDPRVIMPVVNNRQEPARDDNGNWLMADPEQRNKLFTIKPENKNSAVNPKTGNKLLPIYYKHTYSSKEMYYFNHEIVHKVRYSPSKYRGTSPIYSVYKKVLISDSQDDYILQLYQGKRPPKGLLTASTTNIDSLERSWENLLQKARTNPHMPGFLGIQSEKPAKIEFLDFMRSLDEMQFTEFREEIRRVVGAVYGVLPIWQGDMSTSGGLNNEGLQITVTNRAIENNQRDYNEFFYPKLLDAMNFEGWNLRLRPSEEQDEAAALDRQSKILQNARMASELGLSVSYDSDKGDIVIESGAVTVPQSFNSFDNDFNLFDKDDNNDSDRSGKPKDVKNIITKSDKYKLPESARNNARKVLAWKDKYGDDVKGMTETGWRRARQLADNEYVSLDTVRAMASFSRHKDNSSIHPDYKNTPWKDNGYVAWLGWGGDSGISWAKKISSSNNSVEKKKFPSNEIVSTSNDLLDELTVMINKFLKEYKTMPSDEQLEKFLSRIQDKISTNMLNKTRSFMRKSYGKFVEEVEKEVGRNFVFDSVDENAIKVLSEQQVLSNAYNRLSTKVGTMINDIITESYLSPEGINLEDLNKQISHITGLTDSRAETIARTEIGKVSSAARRNSYKKLGEDLLYEHVGPNDNRTTSVSKRIKDRTRGGVSWDDYVRIVSEESAKDFPEWTVNPDFPISHYQSRHTFIARRG